jgi:hypothetical protein
MNANTNNLPSASAVGVTNNQPKENAITTITDTQVAIAPTFNFVSDTDVNKRLKVARMAKQFASMPGVMSSHVGTLQITEERFKGEFFTYQYSDLVEVVYGEECELANQEANRPFTVLKAYYQTDEDVFAFAFAPTGDTPTTYYYKMSGYGLLPSAGDSVTVGGVEYGVRGNHETNLARKLMESLGHDGDQLTSANRVIAKREQEAQAQAVHEAKIAAKYATERPYGWRSSHVASKAVSMTRDEYIENRNAVKEAQNQLFTLLERELWDICSKSVGKLRTEVECYGLCDDEADRYDFVTLAEVERYILKRWATDGFSGENAIRDHVAREFIRVHF